MDRGIKRGKEGLSTNVEGFGIKYLLKNALEHELKAPVPEDPQTVGAYGAAIIARDQSTSC